MSEVPNLLTASTLEDVEAVYGHVLAEWMRVGEVLTKIERVRLDMRTCGHTTPRAAVDCIALRDRLSA